MDLDEITVRICTYDQDKPWAIFLTQIIFFSLRSYCMKRILDSLDDESSKEIPWETLYDLCSSYCSDNYKPYIDHIFQVEHLEEFENYELCTLYAKNFAESMDTIIDEDDSDTQEIFIDYLDKFLYEFFNTQLKESGILIFPDSLETEILNLEPYLKYMEFLESQKPPPLPTPAELLNTPIEEVEAPQEIKAFAVAIAKRKKQFMQTKKRDKAVKRKNIFSQTVRLKHK